MSRNRKIFQNLQANKRPSFFDLLKWKCTGEVKKWPKRLVNQAVPRLPDEIAENEVYLTYINHATLLIQTKGLNLLTDPVFSQRVGPFSWLGLKRRRNPGLSLLNLPKIDVVFLSHNHYDHMDLRSLAAIEKRDGPLHLVPLENGKFLKKCKRVIELDWWQEYRWSDNQTFIMTPAHHWSKRTFWDDCKALWGGFCLRSHDLQLYFAGDTGYSHHFQLIRQKLGNMDISCIPIGAYEPRWIMKEFHIDPKEAVLAHQELGSDFSVGIHFGTFQLTDEAIDDPVIELKKQLQLNQISENAFIAPENGQTIVYSKTPAPLKETPY